MKIMATSNEKTPTVGNYINLFWYSVSNKRYHQTARVTKVENIKKHSFPVTYSYKISFIGKNGVDGIAFMY